MSWICICNILYVYCVFKSAAGALIYLRADIWLILLQQAAYGLTPNIMQLAGLQGDYMLYVIWQKSFKERYIVLIMYVYTYIWLKIFQGGTGNPLLDMYSQYAAAAYSPQVGGLHRLNCYSYILIFYSLFHPPLHDFLSPVPLWQVISSANDAGGDPGASAGTHHLAGAAAAPTTSPIPCGR